MESRPEGARRRPGVPRGDEPHAARRRRPPAADGRDQGSSPRARRAQPRPDETTPRARKQQPRVETSARGESARGTEQRGSAQRGSAQRGSAQQQRGPAQSQRESGQRPRPVDADATRPAARPGRASKQRTSGEIHTRDGRQKAGKPRTKPARSTTAQPTPAQPTAARREAPPASPDADTAGATAPPAPPGRRGRLSLGGFDSRKTWGRGLVALVSVAVLLCTGYAWKSMNGLSNSITQLAGLGLGGADDGAVDILLVGMDSRTDAKGNPLSEQELRWLRAGDDVSTSTDTILLIRIPNDGSSATAISIPRDSYVEVPGIGKSKINAAYGTTREGVRRRAVEAGKSEPEAEREGTLAGRKALIDTVGDLTGVHVDHYAEVGLLGFALLTKAVGGVDVCLKEPVDEPLSGAKFRAGRQTLNGPQALSFVRQRHDLPRGDLDRITRQQVYMASLTQKILSAHTLTDPSKLGDLENAVSRSVVIDNDWDIVQFAEQLKDLSGGRVKFATIPVVDEQGWSEDGQQSVVTVDPNAVQAFTTKLLDGQRPDAPTQRSDYKVDVNNAGTIDGLAGNVSNILTNKGFQAGKTSSTPANIQDSAIYARSADDAGALLLSRDLGGMRVVADPSLPEHQLKLLLTNTFDGPGSISDTGTQADNTPASERVGNNAPPITAGTDGPVCVN
ncbi:LCP family glycopolymer transferase [Gordonia sp. NPDC003429]